MGKQDYGWADIVQPSWERDAECHYGDHYYSGEGATCSNCGFFNAPLLNWLRVEKAQKEGRHHGDHYHLTIEKAKACKTPTHAEQPCADVGGCMIHEASDEWLEATSVSE